MTIKQFKRIQALVAVYVATVVAVAVIKNSFLLAVFGVITGMIITRIVYQKSRQLADERIITISEKAAKIAYSIGMPIVGITAFLLSMWGRNNNEQMMFAGSILAYAALLLISIYSVSFYMLNRKFGAEDEE